MQIRGSRQVVTGLVTNEKINISQDYYRRIRAKCHSLFRTGQYFNEGVLEPQTALAPLAGHLAHIWYVKSRLDRPTKVNKALGFECARAPRELYADFSFFKHFVAIDHPKIVTEGRSDITYLRAALISLAADYPTLVETTAQGPQLKIDFFRPSATTQKLLNVASGCAGLTRLISEYSNRLKSYNPRGSMSPVIIVTDGDKDGDDVVKAAKKQHEKNAKGAPTPVAIFARGPANVYVVQVPKVSDAPTVIEDLFPPALLKTKLNGKSFEKNKLSDDESAYSEVAFAENVVSPSISTIDFSEFKPLLTLPRGRGSRLRQFLRHAWENNTRTSWRRNQPRP